MNIRIPESDLVLPALFCLSLSSHNTISTSDLINQLRHILKPKGEDTQMLEGRNDDKFSQKVRNLKSHDTLVREGFVKHTDTGFKLLTKGNKYLVKNAELTNYLLTNDFKYEDIKKAFKETHEKQKKEPQSFDENVVISEGLKKIVTSEAYQRSSKLRDLALEYYTKSGKISCRACSFNYEDFYGPKLGHLFIEIHHQKPIFKYRDDDLRIFLENAVKNVIPVCSNCHRMIHRKRDHILALSSLKRLISTYGKLP